MPSPTPKRNNKENTKMSKAKEIAITAIQGVVATALVVGLFILFVWGTPDQMSAEYDWTVGVEEAEAAR
jgi:hypothetical protein